MTTKSKIWVCYVLRETEKKRATYTGMTNNFERRLRQHNGEITGGARYTRGRPWHPLFHVVGFENRRQVAQFEWAMKKRRCPKPIRGPLGRVKQLEFLLSLGKLNSEYAFANLLQVRCFMTFQDYLDMAGLSCEEFYSRRSQQDVPFEFQRI